MGFLKKASILLPLLFIQLLAAPSSTSGIPYACNGANSATFSSFPFCNTALPIDNRVKDLVGRLTLDEKVQQLINTASGVPRLGLPKYEWWSEALHGVSNSGPGTRFDGKVPGAVSFPQVILTAASFNATLWKAIGQVVSTEARAMYNVGNSGLTFWSPNVNIFRDPRWGRGQETPGEDPTLASTYAVSYVRGLQETSLGDPNSLKVAACCKHHTAYDLDSWEGADRFHFDAEVSKQDLLDTYEPPFKSCVQDGNVASVMCSYNRINGVPSCVDSQFMAGLLRKQWGLNGYIVSDCDSVRVLYDKIGYTNSPVDAVADSILAGLNMNCGTYLANYTAQAVKAGKISESMVDQSLSYLYTTLMRLGYFNGDPTNQEYGSLGAADVCTHEHRQLAVDAARQGMVLLKNDENTLPLSQERSMTIAVIGPNGNATKTMIGNYAGVPCKYTTPLQGIEKYSKTSFQPGCSDVACNGTDLIDAAVLAAVEADAVVLVVGLDQSIEREAHDRTHLALPGKQKKMVTEVAGAAKGPVVLVIMSGGPIDVSFAKNDTRIRSILWVGYPGEAGGEAIAQVIFGDYNPGGRLPVTWYPNEYTKIPMTDMRMRANDATGYPGRTYRFYTGETVYKFGDGLSYTEVSHSIMAAPTEMALPVRAGTPQTCPSQLQTQDSWGRPVCAAVHVDDLQCESLSFDLHVAVSNTGARDASHVVLLFVHPPSLSHSGAPQKRLVAFERVHVGAGRRERVELKMNACEHLSTMDEEGRKVVGMGLHAVSVGDYKHRIAVSLDTVNL